MSTSHRSILAQDHGCELPTGCAATTTTNDNTRSCGRHRTGRRAPLELGSADGESAQILLAGRRGRVYGIQVYFWLVNFDSPSGLITATVTSQIIYHNLL